MASITVSDQDVSNADTFLTAYLQDKIPDADFSEGGVTRDFVVKAVAYIFAYLEKERQVAQNQQSLLTLGQLPPEVSVDDSVDALLSNWFIGRKPGRVARINATLHFSRAADSALEPTTRFFRTADLVYTPDIISTTVIAASQLRPTVNADGTIADYTVNFTLVATNVGDSYNESPGKFTQVDPFSPFFLYAENLVDGYDGKNIESTAELLLRAPTAITVRNLINSRSIDTVLRDTFSNLVSVLTLGFGDAEMLRDFTTESATNLNMHVGGFTDIYISTSRTDVVETGVVGALFARPDNIATVLRDTSGVNFLTSSVVVGDILRITAGLPTVPLEFVITSILANQLTIHPRNPFVAATDEASPATFVSYTIGSIAPDFNNRVGAVTAEVHGQTSRSIQQSGRIILAGRPHYDVKRVQITNTDTSVTVLTPRVNGTPATGQYQLVDLVPAQSQSTLAVTQLVVDPSYDGLSAQVTYETLVGYDDVQSYVVDPFNRVVDSNPLVRAFHPVYVSLNASFRLKNTATASINTDVVDKAVSDFINGFNNVNSVDVSAVKQFIRDTYPDVGVILDPFQLTYRLLAPDGQVYTYATKDVITLFPSYPSNNARLTNGTDLRSAIVNADIDPTISSGNATLVALGNAALRLQLTNLGVSDRTVRYMSNPADIAITQAVS